MKQWQKKAGSAASHILIKFWLYETYVCILLAINSEWEAVPPTLPSDTWAQWNFMARPWMLEVVSLLLTAPLRFSGSESMQNIWRILLHLPRTCGFFAADQRVIGKTWLPKWKLKQPNVSHSWRQIQFERLLCVLAISVVSTAIANCRETLMQKLAKTADAAQWASLLECTIYGASFKIS